MRRSNYWQKAINEILIVNDISMNNLLDIFLYILACVSQSLYSSILYVL
jgi:hypothetical protein